ncbi:MAG: FAD-dependent oxidoreductase [Thermodesulfobacteriota bacterium]
MVEAPQSPIGSVLVVGGGIGGIQASLDLANAGYLVHLVENKPAIGGVMSTLDKTFPTNDCSMCILSPKLVEVGRHKNIRIHSLCAIQNVAGEAGNFSVTLRYRPRYIDTAKCIACGKCAEKCPKKIPNAFNQGLDNRKAVYVLYPQAVPLKYAIDADHCIYFKNGKCRACEKFCPAGAVDFSQTESIDVVAVGAVILAPGFHPYDPTHLDRYGFGRLKNVVTSMQFERILSASGPFEGHLVRPSDHLEPKSIAWLQCIGSRDVREDSNPYCSSVCCMYAIKEAVIAKEHAPYDLDCAVFFMDMRTHGKEFERCYETAKTKQGVRFIRSRIHTIAPAPEDDVEVRYITEDGAIQTETFSMIVLSIGLETSLETRNLAETLGIELTSGSFCSSTSFAPVETSRKGIFACGAFLGPRDIPQTVIDAGAAAASAGAILTASRNSLTEKPEIIPQTNVIGQRPAIGVFVCKCGINIAGVVDVPAVTQYVKTLPFVEFATDNLYSCSQDTQNTIAELIREKGLNRVVVAACTPKTHEPLFQETLMAAGLNKYLFEMTNIRNHDSWVHRQNPTEATEKAKDLVRMAVEKVALMEPLEEATLEVNQTALVIGGGIAGIAAASSLASQGYATHIVEKSGELGGQARNLYRTARGEDISAALTDMIHQVECDPRITVYLNTTIASVQGFVGNFKTRLESSGGTEETLEHGVAIIATGASTLVPTEYGYGQDPRILTSLELDRKLIDNDPALETLQTAVFIQCVGSRIPERMYCSRVCCTHSIDNAIHLKRKNPDSRVFILYRDIRTYGEKELLYQEAREAGVIFIRYSLNNKPVVQVENGRRLVTVLDPILNQAITIDADLLVLATAIVPPKSEALAKFFKVPLNEDGFFVEKHAKLGPSEFATDGVFLCGLAHYPKPIDESIAQARAAASCAVTLLARKTILTSGNVAKVNPALCSSCGVCVSICPYSAPSFIDEKARFFPGKAEINPVLCKGCGLCVASCRSGAIHLKGFDNDQIFAQIYALSDAG